MGSKGMLLLVSLGNQISGNVTTEGVGDGARWSPVLALAEPSAIVKEVKVKGTNPQDFPNGSLKPQLTDLSRKDYGMICIS